MSEDAEQAEPPAWYIAPALGQHTFTCAHCMANGFHGTIALRVNDGHKMSYEVEGLAVTQCHLCWEYSVWMNGQMVYPKAALNPIYPHADLPDDVRRDFLEARSVLYSSPRAASALLRLAVDRLTLHLEAKGGTLNERIGDLVKRGLPVQMQRTMDYVRVIGNNFVHPGVMDEEDTLDTATTLFECVNSITQTMISLPRQMDTMYARIPEGYRRQIEKRDAP